MDNLLQKLFGLEGRTALVTGASGGIGRRLAVTLARAGAFVGLNGTNEENLQETLRLVEEAGGRGISLPADLGSADRCRRLIEEACAALGQLDILVNNAGMNRRKPVEDVTQDDYETIMAVNLRSAFVLSQAAHTPMTMQGGGKILHIGSMTSFIGLGSTSVYGMTKAALAQLTKTMAVEWAKDNIQVNCLAPGFLRTPLNEKGVWDHPERSEWILNRIPARRPGLPEDLEGAALLLVGPASNYLTGAVIPVDGGFLAGGSWD